MTLDDHGFIVRGKMTLIDNDYTEQ